MRRFYIEFVLTTLVFAHILFGVIWFRARSRLREAEGVVAKENRERLAEIGAATPLGVSTEEGEETTEPGVEVPVEVIFERIAKARKNNDLSGIEREIANLVAAGKRAVLSLSPWLEFISLAEPSGTNSSKSSCFHTSRMFSRA
jgi:hypothetical protein